MDDRFAPSARPVREILDAALAGDRITPGDAHRLLLDGDLLELGAAAHEVRNRFNDPGVATYNVDRNINYTNVCVYRCRFCAFYRPPGHEEGYLVPLEEIGRKVEETLALHGTGILLQGGVNPDLPLQYYVDLVTFLRENYPAIHRHCFSPPEIKFIAKKERMSFRDVLARLKAAGLQSIPGGGAEILSDRIRKEVLAYPKASPEEWLDVMRQAHGLGMRTTATMMYGMGESLADRVEHIARIRDLQDETGGFTAFISWTFQHEHTDLPEMPEVYAHEYLRTLAVTRLFFDNVRHLQTSWVTQGKKIGQLGLAFGADDMGSIMIEENVVSAAGTTHKMTQDEMEHLISAAGYTPRQRTNLYERLVTREDTAELAARYRHALTPEKRDLAPQTTGGTASGLLPVIA